MKTPSAVAVRQCAAYPIDMKAKNPEHRLPGKAFAVAGHTLHILHDGAERLTALLMLIGNARQSLRIFYYMFHSDATGTEVRDALIVAAKRGVKVELMIDRFGSGAINETFFAPLIAAGARYHSFSSRWGLGYFIRNHQKMVIADESQALIGGFNITDEYFDRAGDNSWEDLGAVVSGPQITALVAYYDKLSDLTDDGHVPFLKMRQLIRSWSPSTGPVRWLLGGPTNRISPWARMLKIDMERATKVDMAFAYFSPSQTVLRRITRVAIRGGNVRVILAGKTDNGATIDAARLLYGYLLKRYVQLFEFQTRPLHMKLLVMDDICYIGSANLDIRSLFINMEIMLRVEDKALSAHLRGLIDDMAQHSNRQSIEEHKLQAGWYTRFKWTLAYFLVNSVDYTIGRRIKFRMLRNKKMPKT
jgi:cardiolipin synthase A/B